MDCSLGIIAYGLGLVFLGLELKNCSYKPTPTLNHFHHTLHPTHTHQSTHSYKPTPTLMPTPPYPYITSIPIHFIPIYQCLLHLTLTLPRPNIFTHIHPFRIHLIGYDLFNNTKYENSFLQEISYLQEVSYLFL